LCAFYIRPDDTCPFITEICSPVLDEYVLCWLKHLLYLLKQQGCAPFHKTWSFLTCLQQSTNNSYSEPLGPHHILLSQGFTITLNSHLHLDFPSGLHSSYLLINILNVFFISSVHAICHNHLILLEWMTVIIYD